MIHQLLKSGKIIPQGTSTSERKLWSDHYTGRCIIIVAMSIHVWNRQRERASGRESWGQGSLGTTVLGKITNLSSSQALDESHQISDLWVCYVASEPYMIVVLSVKAFD